MRSRSSSPSWRCRRRGEGLLRDVTLRAGARAGSRFDRIYAVVARVPRGRVATYGQVARLAGMAGQARLVGYALSALGDGSRVPWRRVVNAAGRISLRRDAGPAGTVQRLRLERERVRFDAADSIPLGAFRWRPRSPR